jgi:polyisoprenoid-binding protein YceI
LRKPLTVNVAVRRETEDGSARLGFLATTRINRFDFDMTSGFPLMSRDIEVVISSDAVEL